MSKTRTGGTKCKQTQSPSLLSSMTLMSLYGRPMPSFATGTASFPLSSKWAAWPQTFSTPEISGSLWMASFYLLGLPKWPIHIFPSYGFKVCTGTPKIGWMAFFCSSAQRSPCAVSCWLHRTVCFWQIINVSFVDFLGVCIHPFVTGGYRANSRPSHMHVNLDRAWKLLR